MSDPASPEQAATLTIARQAPNDVGIRQVFISLDNKEFGVLLHGESVTKDVEPGEHRLRVHNTLVWNLKVDRMPHMSS